MYWNRSAADIAAAWQTEIESKLETGSTALLLGGAPDNMIPSAGALLGLQNSIIQRNDIATPALVVGGNSAAWLGFLLPPQPVAGEPISPPPAVIFGGADVATYLAIAGLTAAAIRQNVSSPGSAQNNRSVEMDIEFAPRLQPGAATPWEMLPFIEAGAQPTPPLLIAAAPSDPTGDWIAWGVMLIAFCLVLSALLI